MRGYDKPRVDQFREQVADELERLTRVNQDLEAKAKGFHEQLRAFRERDKALNEALISAQQLRAEIREQAEREAQLILREARAEGERLLEQARSEIRRLSGDVEGLERSRRAYLMQLRQLVERQLAEIDAASAATPPAPVAAVTSNADSRRTSHPTPSWLDTLVKE
jgi:cell division septum initiation protein DivIVA